jgi:large subunit ribosomal protein L25
MAEAAFLNVEVRNETGKHVTKHLRASGKIPAVLYGHGEQTVNISVSADEVNTLFREGIRIVTLKGSLNESAFIREAQWDVFGNSVLHLDFTRVTAGELIETVVMLECRGDAPGLRSGGMLEQPLQELHLKIPSTAMTDRIEVNVNSLELGDVITVAQLELPKGAESTMDPDTVVVQCVEKVEEVDEEEAVVASVEPEVIGRPAEDDEGK